MDIIEAGGPANPPGGSPTGASPHISDGSDATFMQDVIQPSQTTPVIVDFWAPWCGPCRQLGPIIEKAVAEANGAVRLVKIDIDQNPGIAGQLGVKSIPAVVAFHEGKPVDAFMGAQPESQIRAFIAKLGGGIDATPSAAELIAAADEALDAGDNAAAAELFSMVLQNEPENIDAISGLAKTYLKLGETERAREIANMIPEDQRTKPAAAAIFSTLELAAHVAEPDDVLEMTTRVNNSPDDHEARFELAQLLSGQGKHDKAADHLLTILEKNRKWNEGAAKEQLLKVFEAAGNDSDVAKEGRKRLSIILFS